MRENDSRRNFVISGALALGTAVTGTGIASSLQTAEKTAGKRVRILGLNGSPRRGKTTAESLGYALAAAQAVSPDQIEIEIIELTDYALFDSERVFGSAAVKGDGSYARLQAKFAEESVRGIIVGSPVHNSMPSALISAFFAQIDHTVLQGKIGGALSVGAARNGGQESVVNGLNTFLFHEGMLLPGTGAAGRFGALLWNQNDSVAADDFGIQLARSLGERVAKTALVLPPDLLK